MDRGYVFVQTTSNNAHSLWRTHILAEVCVPDVGMRIMNSVVGGACLVDGAARRRMCHLAKLSAAAAQKPTPGRVASMLLLAGP
jgi:hypothetical protein